MRKLFIILFFALAQILYAQKPRLYTTAQGLVNSRLHQLHFDKDNFLWVTTEMGLSRFDGQAFTTFIGAKGNPNALGESNVSCMHEDPEGSHWVGASDGLYYLCRTENRFTHYPVDPGRPNISISSIIDHPLRPKHLLISTYGYGIFDFDTETRQYDQTASVQLSNQLRRYNVPLIIDDGHRRLWALQPAGLQIVDLERLTRVEPRTTLTQQEWERLVVQTAVIDKQGGRLYLGTLESGLFVCDLASMRVQHIESEQLDRLNITILRMSPDGALMIGTESQGLYRFNLHSHAIEKIQIKDCPVNLDHAKIHCIAYDDQQNLWLGLYQKGLLIVPSENGLFAVQPQPGCVTDFAYLPDGTRLFANDGAGLICQKSDGSRIHLDTDNSILQTNALLALATTPEGTAYIGTYKYGIYVLGANGQLRRDPNLSVLDHTSIMTMAYDPANKALLIGTNGQGIFVYKTENRELLTLTEENTASWVVRLKIDSDHYLWVSTEGSILRFNLNQIAGVPAEAVEGASAVLPTIASYKARFDVMNQAPLIVRSYGFEESPDGSIWMATDKGLLRHARNADTLQIITTAQSKPGETFLSILRSPDGCLWMPSSSEMVCYDPRERVMTYYQDTEIAELGSFSGRAAIAWPDGTFAFGGDNGVLSFVPDIVSNSRRPIRPIYFTRLWVNNVPTDYEPHLSAQENVLDQSLWKARRLHLPASSRNFSISFAVQEYCHPAGIHYEYRLKGFEENWHQVLGQDLSANYASLPSGRYTLEVRASTGHARQSNATAQQTLRTLEVIVDAPWYATWWAWLLWIAIGTAIAYVVFDHLRARAHQRRVLVRTEHNRQIKEAKLKMFTSVSHEIKTPLTLIISPLRRLMERKNDNATQSIYEMMYRNALRILMLVNQQMDIRKLDKGLLKLKMQELPLRAFLTDISQFFDNLVLSRQIDFKLTMPEGHEDMTLWADPQQIDKVFFNVLSNAFKYAPDQGRVHIDVTLADVGRKCVISFFNSGSHLAARDQKHVFERFYQGEGDPGQKDSSAAGSGLGLNLALELTELHHGQLTAENVDDGVVFHVVLPMGNAHLSPAEMADAASLPQGQASAITAEGEKLEILKAQAGISPSEKSAEQELVAALSDELQEKVRMRERRANLGFDYTTVQTSSADEKLLQRVVDAIHKNLSDTDFNVDTLSEEVGISRVHLNRKLKDLIGTSPSTLIKSVRLKQAAFLLVQSNVTISEIAYSVGFSSPSYFTSNFSSYFGMTPKEFINNYTENPNSEELRKLLE